MHRVLDRPDLIHYVNSLNVTTCLIVSDDHSGGGGYTITEYIAEW